MGLAISLIGVGLGHFLGLGRGGGGSRGILNGGGGSDFGGGALGSRSFNEMNVNIDAHDAERRRYKLKPEVNLEEAFDDNKHFEVGPFSAGIDRKMNSAGVGDLNLAQLSIMTVFHVSIPSSGELSFRIELPAEKWRQAMDAKTPSEFASMVNWDFQNQELADRFGHKDCLQRVRRIFTTGPGRICCAGKRFSVYNVRGVKSVPALVKFRNTCTSLFKIYAQTAQMQLPDWRVACGGFDWWKDEQEGGQDKV